VICYGHGGQTDFLEDGRTGNLVDLNDTGAFADRLGALARDAGLRRRIADDNLGRVEEYFIDRCAQRYEELFAEVIERSERGRA
jgi:glycogen(starch) synthase